MKASKKMIQTFRVREELKLELLKTIHSFKSKEEPRRKINNRDVEVVLVEMLHRKIV